VLNGKAELKKVSIDPALLRPDGQQLIEDLIVAAHTDAKTKVERVVAEQMQQLARDMGLPPGMMPGG
jgi:DNA-binding protein YbaB